MGSIKKKRREINKFLLFWKSLTVNEKIAFKAFWWNWGRSRIHFIEFFSRREIQDTGPIAWRCDVENGYSWINE